MIRQTSLVVALCLMPLTALGQGAPNRTILPAPEPPFHGKIAPLSTDATPDYPQWTKAPAGAPNVLVVLLDDTGFGQSSTFGGPVATPNFTRLANAGLRYNQFHSVGVCSPTRGALLTGRNSHSVGAGTVTELADGYPGYNAIISRSTATIAEILRLNGYNTAAFGKWHNTPEEETSPAGPFDHWPTHLGFDYFYGFQRGDTDQWNPSLYENTTAVEKPAGRSDYHLTTDIADRAIAWIHAQKSVAPDKPFFVYWASGATHAPHHAPREWIDKFKGQFDQGWDKVREETLARQMALGVVPPGTKLTPRPPSIQAWDDLSADQERLYARMQEVFAGFLAHTDHEVGRILDALDQMGIAENTLIMVMIGDNGPSASGGRDGAVNEMEFLNQIYGAGFEAKAPKDEELKRALARIDQIGGPYSYPDYPMGWGWAGAAPFQWWKAVASHFGGTRNPLIISWPKRITDTGGVRSQFHHCIDLAPTILEVAGIPQPAQVNGVKQKPMEGVSLAYTFADPHAPTRKVTQYFEVLGNRGIFHQGWMASAFRGTVGTPPRANPFDAPWELYKLDEDFSQANDLAARYPSKVKELADLWMAEARKYNVLPLAASTRLSGRQRPSYSGGRTSFTYYPGAVRIPEISAPHVLNRSFSISADVVVPENGAQGVLVTDGGRFGGYALYVMQNKLRFTYNWVDRERFTIASNEPLPSGKVTVKMDFTYDGGSLGSGGMVRLLANGRQIGEGRVEKTIPAQISNHESFDVGQDTGTPVVEDYAVPFPFNSEIQSVTVTVGDR